MILVDSSVWIDYFRGRSSPETDRLDGLLGHTECLVGDLILVEVLQGFALEADFNRARSLLGAFRVVHLGGAELAVSAARNLRLLRRCGVTVRKTINTVIATRCLEDHLKLLHADRDFDAFEEHLGLRVLR